jgi:arylesterase/paraoxonase
MHGMDVVASKTDPDILYIYLVNHRIPLGPQSAREVGADSVIEIFSTTVEGTTMRHLHTIEDHNVIITPNSVSGSADGKSFYFTNDHAVRVGAVSSPR